MMQEDEWLEPFGLLKQMLREQKEDRGKYNYSKKKPERPESKLEALIGKSLEERGIPVRYQVRCDAGIADIVTPDAIYEVKPDFRYPSKLFEAVGQVLVYRQLINPSARAFVVGYGHIGGHSRQYLAGIQAAAKQLDVEIVALENEEEKR